MSAEYIINEGGINRPMNDKEIAEYLELCATIPPVLNKEQQTANETEKQALKIATLTKLGLTADEVASLLS